MPDPRARSPESSAADVPIYTPGSSSSRTDWSLSGLAPLGLGRDVPANGKPDRQAASSGAAPAAVVRKNGADAVLSAERGNLRVEHQVAARICLASDRDEKFEEFRTRLDNLAARSVGDALDERGRLCHGGRRIEHAPMRHHPHEFRNAEDRESQRSAPSARATSREAAAPCSSVSPRCA